ncbi:MAG: hypothetical protein PHW17_13985, partial [Desulfobacterales bacterium]|nr:hypothetical protein [Desulfobacterales bacterium]
MRKRSERHRRKEVFWHQDDHPNPVAGASSIPPFPSHRPATFLFATFDCIILYHCIGIIMAFEKLAPHIDFIEESFK